MSIKNRLADAYHFFARFFAFIEHQPKKDSRNDGLIFNGVKKQKSSSMMK
jgi:hypothetical protein